MSLFDREKIIRTAKITIVAGTWAAAWLLALQTTHLAILLLSPLSLVAPALWLAAAVILTALAAAVLDPRLYFLVSAAISFSYLIFFPLTIYAVLAIALLFFGFWRSFHRSQFELHNNIKFAASPILRLVTSLMLATFMLVVAFEVYSVTAKDIAADEGAFYGRLSATVTRGVLPILERQLSGFDPGLSLDDYLIGSFSKNQLDLKSLPADLREQQLEQSRQEILGSLGIQARGDEKLSRIADLAVQARLKDWARALQERGLPLPIILPAIYALLIFYTLRVIAFFLGIVSRAFGAALFWILRKTGFLKVETVQILAERVTI